MRVIACVDKSLFHAFKSSPVVLLVMSPHLLLQVPTLVPSVLGIRSRLHGFANAYMCCVLITSITVFQCMALDSYLHFLALFCHSTIYDKNHAAMLRYNNNLRHRRSENQQPRCNKMATRMGYVGTPEAFTPGSEDWSLYAQRFHHFLLANSITEESQKLHLLLALVGNLTFRLLTNLVAPRQPGELTYKGSPHRVGESFQTQAR